MRWGNSAPHVYMPNKKSLSPGAYLYVCGVIVIGCAVIAHSAATLVVSSTSLQWLVLAALTVLTGSFSVQIPAVGARLSVSDAFVLTSVLLFGPAAATVTVAIDGFIISLSTRRRTDFWLRSLFNCAALALAVWLAGTMFFRLAQTEPGYSSGPLHLERHLWELFTLASTYFLLNSWLVAIAVAFERRINAFRLWATHFPWLSLNYFGGVSVAALLVTYTPSVNVSAIGIILPLLVISYLSHRTSLGRIQDAQRHVAQVDALYMSTIEALAMAVDARDQVTHGHIRRVQVYAVELAKRLGIDDDMQLRGLQAAALLHDMGKLAIPDHILNKPGKLTASEFEEMKRHADIGADLLSSITFPYPVVPIVRHHHEQWDGKGYPSQIAGSEIPLGARILSVVDCFDALTSDRPYRSSVSVQEAFQILRERRGSMYDPQVVDKFTESYAEIAPLAIAAGREHRSLFEQASASLPETLAITASALEQPALS
jgi:putative nucleotidyltransferase with HDIG domain